MVDIIIKDKDKAKSMGWKQFIGEVSKGSARPAFCNPGGISRMQETVNDMRRNLEQGNVAPHQREQYKMTLKKHEDRVSAITDEKENAKKLYQENQEYWDKRADQLKKEISAETPTKAEIKDRMVNPHTILRNEMAGLRDKKLEYQTIQHLREDDPNISYIQRRK